MQDEIHDLMDLEREVEAEARPSMLQHRPGDSNDDVEIEELSRRLRRTPAPTELSSTPAPTSLGSRVIIQIDDEEEIVETTVFVPTTPTIQSTEPSSRSSSRTLSSRRRPRQFTDLDNEEVEVRTPTKKARTNEVLTTEARELHGIRRLTAYNQSPRSAREIAISRATTCASTVRSVHQATIDRSGQGMSPETAITLDDD